MGPCGSGLVRGGLLDASSEVFHRLDTLLDINVY
jgi:hypothetical protein